MIDECLAYVSVLADSEVKFADWPISWRPFIQVTQVNSRSGFTKDDSIINISPGYYYYYYVYDYSACSLCRPCARNLAAWS